jgi:alanine racemase
MTGPRLEVDLAALARNWRMLDERSHYYTKTSAVVKADGYGTGASQAARTLQKAGCERFYVAWVREGVALRKALGGDVSIAVLHGVHQGEWGHVLVNRLEPVLNTEDQVREWVQLGEGRPPSSLHLDTGLNRLGLPLEAWRDASLAMHMALPTHLISHLACADEPDHPMNGRQVELFNQAGPLWPGSRRSLAATAGIYLGSAYHLDETRPGIGLYGGGPPPPSGPAPEPVVRLMAPVLQVRTVEAGQSTGYGATWTASARTTLAVLGLGYADGFLRTASNRGYEVVAGEKRRVVGRVSMDIVMVDVTGLDVRVGDMIEIFGPHLSMTDQAAPMGTIDYELLVRMGQRVERRHLSET